MHNGVRGVRFDERVKPLTISEITDDQLGGPGYCLAMTATQVIVDKDLVSSVQQFLGYHAAYVASPPL